MADDVYEKNINMDLTVKTRLLLEMLGANVVMTRTGDAYVSIYGRIALTGLQVLERATGLPGLSGELDPAFYRSDLEGIIAENTGDWDGAMTGRGMHLGFGRARGMCARLMDLERQFTDTIFVSIHANSALPDTEARGLQVYYSPTEEVYASEVASVIKDRDVDQFGYPVYKAYTYYDDLGPGHAGRSDLQCGIHAGARAGNGFPCRRSSRELRCAAGKTIWRAVLGRMRLPVQCGRPCTAAGRINPEPHRPGHRQRCACLLYRSGRIRARRLSTTRPVTSSREGSPFHTGATDAVSMRAWTASSRAMSNEKPMPAATV